MPVQVKTSAPTSLSQAIQMQLAGVKQITISAPGVLLDQWTPDQLQVRASTPKAVGMDGVKPWPANARTVLTSCTNTRLP